MYKHNTSNPGINAEVTEYGLRMGFNPYYGLNTGL